MADLLRETGLTGAPCRKGRDSQAAARRGGEGGERRGGKEGRRRKGRKT